MAYEKTEGTISLLQTKMSKKDKESYIRACKSRGVSASLVTRKLVEKWMAGEIKLEID